MTVKEIAVIGGGSGALTTAGDMALAGFNVRMWTAFPREYEKIYASKIVKLKGLGRTGDAAIPVVTRDLKEALQGRRIICSPSPAFAQKEVPTAWRPMWKTGRSSFCLPDPSEVISSPKGLKKKALEEKDVSIAEPGTLPYLTRKVAPDEVLVSGHTVRLPVGVFPAKNAGTCHRQAEGTVSGHSSGGERPVARVVERGPHHSLGAYAHERGDHRTL